MPGAPIVGGAQPPLQTSGAIGMSDINNQFEITYNTQIALRLAETGYYAGVNVWSTSKPNAAAPAALSEWYGYHHTQPMPVHDVTVSASWYSDNGSGGVNIGVYLGEAAVGVVTIGVKVYWIDDFTSAITDSNHFGDCPTGYASFVIYDCYPPTFTSSYYGVSVISASPDPNYDQNYIY